MKVYIPPCFNTYLNEKLIFKQLHTMHLVAWYFYIVSEKILLFQKYSRNCLATLRYISKEVYPSALVGKPFTIKFFGPHRACKPLNASFDRNYAKLHKTIHSDMSNSGYPQSIISLNQSGTKLYILENVLLYRLPPSEQRRYIGY